MKRILLAEDDTGLVSGLVFALEKAGYHVDVAASKEDALAQWTCGAFDLVILDINLPDGSGYDLCRQIRKTSVVPILFLTALDDEINMTMGLDMGGDDYITKPFRLSVLLSRINALLRRSADYRTDRGELAAGGIKIVPAESAVYKNGEKVDLTSGEYRLLKYLIENKDMVLSADRILAALWDCDEKYVDANTLTVYIRRLRMKIEEDPSAPTRIVTVRGMGYKWNSET